MTNNLILESRQHYDKKYNTKNMVDTLYVKDLLETYSMKSDLIIM